jgi:hypothetical protein
MDDDDLDDLYEQAWDDSYRAALEDLAWTAQPCHPAYVSEEGRRDEDVAGCAGRRSGIEQLWGRRRRLRH